MKKILLATSMLAATTGFAAAEVTVSGSARMGLIHDRVGFIAADPLATPPVVGAPGSMETLFTSRVRVKFSMVGTTDGGVEFGASVRADQSGQGNTANSDSNVYVSMNGLKLTMGDNDSAANALVGHVSGVGLTGLSDLNELRYLGQTDTSVLVEYSAGALSFAASSSQLNAGDEALSIAGSYSTDAFSVALGYEDTASASHLALKGTVTFGAATVKAVVSDTDIAGDDTQFAVSVDYVAGAGTYTLFVTDEGTINNYGIGAAYDLGGGASIIGGIVNNDTSGDTIADLGISMSF